MSCYSLGKLGRVDNGLALFKDCGLGQSRMPGTFPVARLTADTRFDESLLLKIDTGGMASAALLKKWALVPVCFMIIDPAISIYAVLNRRNVKLPVLFHQEALLPLAAQDVSDLIYLGYVDLCSLAL